MTYYLETIRAKVVMLGIKPKFMKCRFELTYDYDLLTYLETIRTKVVMLGIKPKLTKEKLKNYNCLQIKCFSQV
jgi:hypothetical protein